MVIKFKVDGPLVLISAACLYIAIAAILMSFPINPIWFPKNSSDLASWFQAVGSILGIGIAILIPFVQHKKSVEKEVVVAVLHAITMSENLRILYKKLDKLADGVDGYMCGIPYGPDINYIFREVSSIKIPDLAGQVDLSAVGMVYYRRASSAALSINELQRSINIFYTELDKSRDRGIFILGEVVNCANIAATKCHEARMELENFIALNGIYKDS